MFFFMIMYRKASQNVYVLHIYSSEVFTISISKRAEYIVWMISLNHCEKYLKSEV